jgi:hypothetical protein
MSAVWSFVGQYCISIDPSSTSCLMKWQCTSTCLVCLWKTRFLASLITPWLSHKMGVGFVCYICIFESILLSQAVSSCSSIFCFCQWKGYCMLLLAGPCDYTHAKVENISRSGFSIIDKTYPIWICIPTQSRVFASAVQNAKVKCPFHISQHSLIQCSTFGVVMNLEMKLIVKLKSGLVAVRYIKLPTSFLYTDSLITLESVLVEIFLPFSIGVLSHGLYERFR